MKLPPNRWTPQEEAILVKGYTDGTPLLKIAEMVGRNWGACCSRAKRLGLVHRNSNKKRNPVHEDRPNSAADYASSPLVFPPVLPTLAYVPLPENERSRSYAMVRHVE